MGRSGRGGQGPHREGQRQGVLRRARHRRPRGDARGLPDHRADPERTWKKHNYDLFLWPPLNLWEFSKATIAQVHGYCVGGGTVYGYLTDLTIASDDAYFQMPLPQGFGLPGAQTLIEPWVLMNWKRAYEYLYLAPTLTARRPTSGAWSTGSCRRADLESTVEEMAATIARMPLTTILTIKAGVKRAWETWECGSTCRAPPTSPRSPAVTDVREFMAKRAGCAPGRWPPSRSRRPPRSPAPNGGSGQHLRGAAGGGRARPRSRSTSAAARRSGMWPQYFSMTAWVSGQVPSPCG